MKTPIIIAGLAALVLMSPKSSTKAKTDSKKGIDKLGTKPEKTICTDLQYKDDHGKCIDFWIEGETDQFVLDEINNQISKLKDKSLDALCADKVIDAKLGEYAPNDNLQKIIKETIHKLWPDIALSSLPPTAKSPNWLIKIWTRTNMIYAEKICGGEAG